MIEFNARLDTPVAKLALRERLAADTAKFLASGGEITHQSYDPTDEICARVGRWTECGERMEDEALGDIE